jgi:hypothetical protein
MAEYLNPTGLHDRAPDEGGPCPLLVCLAGVVQVDHPPVVGEQFVN